MKSPARLDARCIRRYWKERAKDYGTSPEASWADLPMIELETRQIGARLDDDDYVLDVGCGNGYSTVRFAAAKRVRIRGVDFIPGMIRNARLRLRRKPALSKKVRFEVGDITALKGPGGVYDKVVAVRVLINLVHGTDRGRALHECARVLKPGGRLLLSEAMLEGWKRLNQFRKEWELDAIPMPPFNRYLNEKELLSLCSPYFRLVESVNFSSTYFVGTRVLKPLLGRLLKKKMDPADPLTHWNRWFSSLPAWGDYGTQKLFVFEKK